MFLTSLFQAYTQIFRRLLFSSALKPCHLTGEQLAIVFQASWLLLLLLLLQYMLSCMNTIQRQQCFF